MICVFLFIFSKQGQHPIHLREAGPLLGPANKKAGPDLASTFSFGQRSKYKWSRMQP